MFCKSAIKRGMPVLDYVQSYILHKFCQLKTGKSYMALDKFKFLRQMQLTCYLNLQRTEYITFQKVFIQELSWQHHTKVKYSPKVPQTTEYFLGNVAVCFLTTLRF